MSTSSVLDKFGVQDVPDTFKNFILGRTVIVDGDDACYSCSAGAAKLSTAQKRFKTAIYEIMFLTKAQFARVHLTPKGCYKNGRHLLLGVKPYQGNRKGKPKPALLEMLRDTAVDVFTDDTDVDVFPQMYYEADDACVMDAYTVQNCIMWSKDKDLNLAPCTRYHIETGKELTVTNRFGWIGSRFTEALKEKADGHGTKFFWLQMLMGDTADNVKGILKYNGKLCGELTALEILRNVETEDTAANLVLDAYRVINQNPVPEAEALWLLRSTDDSASGYIWSLGLSDENRAFFSDCYNRKWKMTQEEYNERDL